jgi:transcriptional regulator with XRE-family HTH domain
VARNLRRLRVRQGLSQEALAVDAEIDRTYVSRVERGLQNPTVAVLEKLSKALAAEITELATTNMKPVMDGITLFDRAKANINSQIIQLEPAGGWVAIVGFGQDLLGVRDDCDRYKPIYPLARINVQEANQAFNEVHIVGQIAPLAKAIDTAVKQYSDLRPLYPGKDVEGFLVLLTASENGCQNMTLADAIAEVETAFRNNGVSVQYYGQTIFTAVIALALPNTDPRASQIYSMPVYQRERNYTLLIVAESPQDLQDAVTAVTNLSDADYNVRQRGCATLRSLLGRHNDKKSQTILTKACRG